MKKTAASPSNPTEKTQRLFALIKDDPDNARWHYDLGMHLKSYPESMPIGSQPLTSKQCFFSCLTYDLEEADYWREMAVQLDKGETVFIDGKIKNTFDCFEESLKWRDSAMTWADVAIKLMQTGRPSFKRGKEDFTPTECLVKALGYNDKASSLWASLGVCLDYRQTLDGSEAEVLVKDAPINAKNAFENALALDPQCFQAWAGLASILGDTKVNVNGHSYSRLDCRIFSLLLDPEVIDKHSAIAALSELKNGDKVILEGKTYVVKGAMFGPRKLVLQKEKSASKESTRLIPRHEDAKEQLIDADVLLRRTQNTGAMAAL